MFHMHAFTPNDDWDPQGYTHGDEEGENLADFGMSVIGEDRSDGENKPSVDDEDAPEDGLLALERLAEEQLRHQDFSLGSTEE